MKYRQRRAMVEAFQWSHHRCDPPGWFGAALRRAAEEVGSVREHSPLHGDKAHVLVRTPKGVERAEEYDWLVRHDGGAIYACERQAFAERFELVSDRGTFAPSATARAPEILERMALQMREGAVNCLFFKFMSEPDWDYLSSRQRRKWIDLQRDVLLICREPTYDMIEAGAAGLGYPVSFFTQVWRNMIDRLIG